jgi:signal transduction histidine kinase
MSSTILSKKFAGIRERLTLVYSTLFGLFICLFAYFSIGHLNETSRKDFDAALLNFAIDASDSLYEEDKITRLPGLKEVDKLKLRPFPLESTTFVVRDSKGDILAEDPTKTILIPFEKNIADRPNYTHRFLTILKKDEKFRAINLKLKKVDDPSDYFILQVAVPLSYVIDQERKLFALTGIVIILLIFLSSFVSYIIAGSALAPIKLLTETASHIVVKNLSKRVPDIKTGDEVEDLTQSFNELLERLQRSFEAQEHFVANASHQLNTPLAIIKGELDVLEQRERSLDEYRKFNKSLREEVERLIDLVKNMLMIARIEAGQEDSFRLHPMRLDEALIGTISRLTPKAKDKKVSVKFYISEELNTEELIINGERQLISSMFENLLDNAIKYTPEESTVSIEILKEEFLSVRICDEGPGMKLLEFQNILNKRFRRGSMTLMPGTGIGLSIAQKIALHHKAEIHYKKLKPQGSEFSVVFTPESK